MNDEKEIKEEKIAKADGKENEEKEQEYDPAERLAYFEECEAAIEREYHLVWDTFSNLPNASGYQDCDKFFTRLSSKYTDLNLFLKKTGGLWNRAKRRYTIDYVTKDKTAVAVEQYYSTLEAMQDIILAFRKLANDAVEKQVFKYAFTMILFDNAMNQLVSASYNDIITAFNEYHNFRVRYSTADIYKELKIRKDTPPEEIYHIVCKHMDDYVGQTKCLKNIIGNEWQNKLYVIDRYTCAFHYIYQAKDSIMGVIQEARNLAAQCEKVESQMAGKCGQRLSTCIKDLLNALANNVTYRLQEYMDRYANESSNVPYAIMHYDVTVTDVANRWLTISLPDPLTVGTRYVKMLNGINKSFSDTARVIARNAAKWGID